jgi:hypothetical protein
VDEGITGHAREAAIVCQTRYGTSIPNGVDISFEHLSGRSGKLGATAALFLPHIGIDIRIVFDRLLARVPYSFAGSIAASRREVKPDRVFSFEPVQARELEWLPLAVRYKLDACGLKISLQEWQSLHREERAVLLHIEAGAAFDRMVLELFPGARLRRGSPQPGPSFGGAKAELPVAQGCPAGMDMWLRSASEFELYLAQKILRLESIADRRRALRELIPSASWRTG